MRGLSKKHLAKERTERRVSAVTSLAMCALTVLAQIATSLLLAIFLQESAQFVYAALQIMGAIIAIRVYQRPGSPSYKLVWMCLLVALPVAGMLLFLVWGGSRQDKSQSLRKVALPPQRESERMASAADLGRLRRRSPDWGRLAAYLTKRDFLLYRNTDAQYFPTGETMLEDLIQHLKQAEVYIFMEYYILAEGALWDRIFAVLKERAAAGVEVSVIFDDFGNLTRLSDAMLQEMQRTYTKQTKHC